MKLIVESLQGGPSAPKEQRLHGTYRFLEYMWPGFRLKGEMTQQIGMRITENRDRLDHITSALRGKLRSSQRWQINDEPVDPAVAQH